MSEEEHFSQIDFSKEFISALLDKLKVGNQRGIHLNALPGRYAARLDIKDLEVIPGAKDESFLKALFEQESFEFKIDFESVDMKEADDDLKKSLLLLARKLNNLTYEYEDQFLEFGIRNFGFGYPLLIRRDKADPSKVIKAPILIWKLEIEKSKRKDNEWTIQRTNDSPIVVNELLRNHVLRDAQVKLEDLSEEILDDGIVDKKELAEVCTEALRQVNTQEQKPFKAKDIVLKKCPRTKQDIESLATDDAWIQWSGIFGIYRSRKESIIRRNEEMLEKIDDLNDEPLKLEKFRTSTISAVDTDPSKEELINTLTDSEIKTIQGPPGTGKSQALTAIITNVLQNEGRCLVVCEKKTALDVVYENLKKVGLEDLCAVIDDVNGDRSKVVKAARNQFTKPTPRARQGEFERKYRMFKNLQDEVNASHKSVLEKVFGEESWKDAIGIFLRYARRNDFEGLEKKIEKIKFDFSPEEHDEFRELLISGESLHSFLSDTDDVLEKHIDGNYFEKPYTLSAQKGIIERVRSLHDTGKDLESKVAGLTLDSITYNGISLIERGELVSRAEELKRLLGRSDDLMKVVDELKSSEYYSDQKLNRSSTGIVPRFVGVFRKDVQEWISKKEEFYKEVSDFATEMDRSEWLPERPESLRYGHRIKADLDDLVKDVVSITAILKEDLAGYKKLIGLISDLDALERKIDSYSDSPLRISLEHRISSIKAWAEYEEDVRKFMERITRLEEALDNYRNFHAWKNFLTDLSPIQTRVVKSVLKTVEENWADAFSAAYYYLILLSSEQDRDQKTIERELHQLSELSKQLMDEQPSIIENIWGKKLTAAKRNYENRSNVGVSILYNLRKNRRYNKSNSLRKIIETDFDLFTSCFPILLVNPVVADSILPLEPGLFNVVMFDEASQLRIEDTFTSLVRGQYKIIAGDKHQMPPSNYFQAESVIAQDLAEEMGDDEGGEVGMTEAEASIELARSESLLDYSENLTYKTASYLDYHYRSRHPALIEFSNQAFYGGNLVPLSMEEDYAPIELHNIGGTWKDHVNEIEAECVINVLEILNPDDEGKYPSVGIATFNADQRNYIIDYINDRSTRDDDFASRMDGIRESGFFVKNLENIQGDEKDVIIISTTYGPDENGRFRQHFGPINQDKGYKLLNVIVTRAKHKLFVCTSIPRDRYMAYAEHLEHVGNNKKAILYAYLAYAESVSERDQDGANAVLERLHDQTHDIPRSPEVYGDVESPFEQEVYEMLLERYPEDRIKVQHKVSGFRIDFVVKRDDAPPIAIECDGKTYHSSNEAHAYDRYRQKELEDMGFVVYRIWSTSWWHDHEREFNKMVEFIEKP